ncbi:MAG: SUMF1/EgtB/PvdO family nonheme iron enzyme [Leptospiraceae bacterium]|nr:SUMF1/EgtB/PvdO family nonheme iron enzyme [Leptospiraceae bacterium]MCP5496455.1 SUMF1/EgtB/PvdO family nonheme iron enzyme [Leptospiraceae bacterium]
MTLQVRIRKLMEAMGKGIYGREEVIRLSMLAALSGQSIFLLGPPGVAKSLIARRLKLAFKGKQKEDGTFEDIEVFEYLMGRFSTPDEVFGPLDINKLTDEKGTKYERIIDKYLPGANIVFLDEIWKASPAIQNSLLTVINEKIFRNGDTIIPVPLRGLIAASNELPTKDSGLEALWDRFIIREYVDYLDNEENFRLMVESSESPKIEIPEDYKISDDEYLRIQEEIEKVKIPNHIFDMTRILRGKLSEYNETIPDEKKSERIIVSDRRWKKIFRLLRTSAHCNGRNAVDALDFFLVEKCINQTMTKEEKKAIHEIVCKVVEIHGVVKLKDLSEYEALCLVIDNHLFVKEGKTIIRSKLDTQEQNFKKEIEKRERQEKQKQQAEEAEKQLQEAVKKSRILVSDSLGMEFVLIPAGEFMMGASSGDTDASDNEKPQHKVFITKPFYMGKYPVTQKQWKTVTWYNPSYFKGDDLPVECVSWDDVQEFIKKLNVTSIRSNSEVLLLSDRMNQKAIYRLPTETEWEYAARAGTTTKYYWGDDHNGDYCWYDGNSGGKTQLVGQKKPNNWGLYDMIGNVWEWCEDFCTYLHDSHVLKGGSWGCSEHYLYVFSFDKYSSNYGNRHHGFRLVMEV